MQRITTHELREMLVADREGVLLVNVLDPADYRRGYIPGSTSIPLTDEEFIARIKAETRSPGDKVVVYCSGRRSIASRRAAERLEEVGFKNVFNYEAGMEGWIASELPVESSRSRRSTA